MNLCSQGPRNLSNLRTRVALAFVTDAKGTIRQKRFHFIAVTIFFAALGVSPAAADELILRDGRKINGTIVGFENGMFRVETEFGFALVKKEKVSTVNVSEGGSKGGIGEGAEKKNPKAASKLGARSVGDGSVQATAHVEADIAKALNSQAEALSSLPKPAPVTTPRPAPVSHPVNEPLPSPLRDHVEGNSYVNDSFQFAMFKPPGWKIYEGVPKETGYGIMAMGTEDEQTLLIVDREVWSGPPDVKNDRAVEKLRQTYQDFQKISESPSQLDGLAATRRLFKGVLDGVEWHGVSIHLARGNTVFGIIGLTSAETYQFQQAVLNKIVNSFHFIGPPSPSTPSASLPHVSSQ